MKDSAPRCEDVADKLVRLFGWRQTYPVQKLQRNILPKPNETVRIFFLFWYRKGFITTATPKNGLGCYTLT